LRKIAIAAALVCALSSCAWDMTLMPRDSGQTYSGTFKGNGMGVGSITVTIDGVTYTGPAVRVASNDTFGFANMAASNNRGLVTTGTGTFFAEGDKYVKAILSAPNGHGLRCDLVGRSHGGGGICVGDDQRVYDAVLVAK
jgi:hypothetical protein